MYVSSFEQNRSKIANMDQLLYTRRTTIHEGPATGAKLIDVTNGCLHFSVLEDRGLDIYNLEYKGTNLAYLTKNGLFASSRCGTAESDFSRQFAGGALMTGGLTNTGPGCTDEKGVWHPLHGRLNITPAVETYTRVIEKDVPEIEVGGKVVDSRTSGQNLELIRRIKTSYRMPAIHILDEVRNLSPREAPFMLLYHMNFGFPFLDEGVRIFLPPHDTKPRTEAAKERMSESNSITVPEDTVEENVYFHTAKSSAEDSVGRVLVWNGNLKLAVVVEYSIETLPILVQWKLMRSGEYALGIEPSNSYIMGRQKEDENASLKRLAGYQSARFQVSLRILDGEELMDAYINANRLS